MALWRYALATALVTVLFVGELLVLVTALDRLGLLDGDIRDVDTWHGRPISRADYEPEGFQAGFFVFLVATATCLFVTVTAVSALLGIA